MSVILLKSTGFEIWRDGDGIDDGSEVFLGLDPLDASDAGADEDGDGYSNLEEFQAMTDMHNGASNPYARALAERASWGAPGNFQRGQAESYGSVEWGHPLRSQPVCPGGSVTSSPARFDQQVLRFKDGVCSTGFVQDFHREWVFNFKSYKEEIPAYLKITPGRKSHHGYMVGGAGRLAHAGKTEVYGAMKPGAIRIDEAFLKRVSKSGRTKYVPPNIAVTGPYFLNIVADEVWPQHEEVLGLVIPLNDNHDNGNPAIADYDAAYIPGLCRRLKAKRSRW